MKQLEEEFKDIIKKNLPQHVGEALKERLEQAEKDVFKIGVLTEELSVKNSIINDLNQSLNDYKALDERNASLTERERLVYEKENKLEVETLTYQLQSEKDKTLFSQNLALGLVRNTNYRKNVFDNENSATANYDQYGNQIFTNTSKSYNEEKTEE